MSKHARDSFRLAADPKGEPHVAIEKPNGFDELVVGKWFHMEQMDTAWWWLRLGNREADIKIDHKGQAQVTWRDEE